MVNNFGINGNGGTAKSQGLELAASLYPTSGLTLSANGAYTKQRSSPRTPIRSWGKDGDPLPYVPEWSFGLNARLRVDAHGQHSRVRRRQPGLHGRPHGGTSATGPPTAASASSTATRPLNLPRGRLPRPLVGRALREEPDDTSGRVTVINEPAGLPNGAVGPGSMRPRTVGVSMVATRFWGS